MSQSVFDCPLCESPFQAPSLFAGRSVKCPHCKQVVNLPAAESTAATNESGSGSRSKPSKNKPTSTSGSAPPPVQPLQLKNAPVPSPTAPEVISGPPEPPQPNPPNPPQKVIACPECAGKFQVSSEFFGQAVGCPHCRQPVQTDLEGNVVEESQPELPTPSISTRGSSKSKKKKSSSSATAAAPDVDAAMFAPGFDPAKKSRKKSAAGKSAKIEIPGPAPTGSETGQADANQDKPSIKSKPTLDKPTLDKLTPKKPKAVKSESSTKSQDKSKPNEAKAGKAEKVSGKSPKHNDSPKLDAPPLSQSAPGSPTPNPPPPTSKTPPPVTTPPVPGESQAAADNSKQTTDAKSEKAGLQTVAPKSASNTESAKERAKDEKEKARSAKQAEEAKRDHDELVAMLPPKFVDPSMSDRFKHSVLIPNASGGFTELDAGVTRVSYRGTEYEVASADSASGKMTRLIYRIIIFILCAAMLYGAIFVLFLMD